MGAPARSPTELVAVVGMQLSGEPATKQHCLVEFPVGVLDEADFLRKKHHSKREALLLRGMSMEFNAMLANRFH